MEHPRLGRLEKTEFDWEGTIPLPLFAVRGTALRRDDDAPAGHLKIRIDDRFDTGISPEQEQAIDHLLDNEPAVLNAVWAELAPQFSRFDLNEEIICPEVEVSSLNSEGTAYLSFQIDADAHLEHGFAVVYHPTRGTFWGDSEALNALTEPDDY